MRYLFLVGLYEIAAIHIPFTIRNKSELDIRVRMPGVFGARSVLCQLSPCDLSGAFVSGPLLSQTDRRVIFHTMDGIELGIESALFRVSQNPVPDMAENGLCAIGPGSPFLSEYGSVDLIRFETNRTGLVRLGESRGSFESNYCVPGSLIHIQSRRELAAYNREVFDANVTAGSTSSNETRHTGLMQFMSNPYHPLSVPREIYDALLRIVGAQRGAFIHFGNCTAVMSELPDIKIDLFGGHIILFPDDYVKRIVGDDMCQLSVTEATCGPASFNPFVVSRWNVRFERGIFFFCDSQIF
jgi:hypothetical protein